jgi:putative tributyrin esterase
LLPTERFATFESSGRKVGQVQQVTVYSASLGRRADLSVFAPSSLDAEAEVPMFVLLHGVYGSHWSWDRQGDASRTVEEMVHAGAIRPCVIVMPSDGLFGVGSGYVRTGEEDAERWITEDVTDAARMLYPGAGSQGVGIAGLSMGGLGALRLAARHPELYRAAVAMSPLTSLDAIGSFTGQPEKAPAQQRGSGDVVAELTASRGAGLGLRISCGRDDLLLSSVRTLHQALSAADVPHEYTVGPGGHDWTYWAGELPNALRFLDRLV